MNIIIASDSSLLVVLSETAGADTSARVFRLFHALQARHDPRIQNLHPGYTTLLVDFEPLAISHREVEAIVRDSDSTAAGSVGSQPRVVRIPVCYGGEFGPDLADVAGHCGLPEEEVIRRHQASVCEVAFLGFTAGFAYLSGMAPELSTPRLSTPRRSVAAGSVGIAGGQTGIYPTTTPGGWRLIGRTPLQMFAPQRQPASLLSPGDHVQFCAIDRPTFDRIATEQP